MIIRSVTTLVLSILAGSALAQAPAAAQAPAPAQTPAPAPAAASSTAARAAAAPTIALPAPTRTPKTINVVRHPAPTAPQGGR
jgi:hypothetical protein